MDYFRRFWWFDGFEDLMGLVLVMGLKLMDLDFGYGFLDFMGFWVLMGLKFRRFWKVRRFWFGLWDFRVYRISGVSKRLLMDKRGKIKRDKA